MKEEFVRTMSKKEIEIYDFLNQLEGHEVYPLARFLNIEWFLEGYCDREEGTTDMELLNIYYPEIADEISNIMSEKHCTINDLITGIEKEMLLIRIEYLEDQVEELMERLKE
jgi:hypothetical protein